ncbi:hypothetical protein II654_02745 [bacterium]|nr:hypothetical protein [bacterium]
MEIQNKIINEEKYKEMYWIDMPQLKQFKYIISVRKFEYIKSDSIPISGQICLNNKILAKIIFWYLRKWSYKHYGSIAVMISELNKDKRYDAILR